MKQVMKMLLLKELANIMAGREREEESREKKVIPPWHNVFIPKSIRKSKTYEELQEIKKEIWEKKNKE
jgi:hypothetical protein